MYDPRTSGALFSWHRGDRVLAGPGGAVTRWYDLSGNSNDLLVSPQTGVFSQRWHGYALGGRRPGVRCCESVYRTNRCVTGLSPRSVFMVLSQTALARGTTNPSYWWLGAITTGVEGITLGTDGSHHYLFASPAGATYFPGVPAATDPSYDIALYSYDGTTALMYINGVLQSTTRNDSISSSARSAFYVGGREDYVYLPFATIHETIQIARAHTAAELAQIYQMLRAYYH